MTTNKLYVMVFAAGMLCSAGNAWTQSIQFTTPTHLGNAVNSASPDSTAVVSRDGLTLWLSQSDLPSQIFPSIHESKRQSTAVPFGEAVNIQGSAPAPGLINVLGSVSGDGLSLYYDSADPGGSADIFVVTRASAEATFDFSNPQPLTELNTADTDQAPHVSQDGLTIAFASSRAGGAGGVDLYMATRENLADPFGAPVNLSSVNTSALENTPRFTDDLLTLYFYSDRLGGFGGRDIYVTTRESITDPFGAPLNLGADLNTEHDEAHPFFSEPLSTLFFSSDRPGGIPNAPVFAEIPGAPGSWDIWQAQLVPEPSGGALLWIAALVLTTLTRERRR